MDEIESDISDLLDLFVAVRHRLFDMPQRFTRVGSQVQSLSRPPEILLVLWFESRRGLALWGGRTDVRVGEVRFLRRAAAAAMQPLPRRQRNRPHPRLRTRKAERSCAFLLLACAQCVHHSGEVRNGASRRRGKRSDSPVQALVRSSLSLHVLARPRARRHRREPCMTSA
jgi:hypothetical protein